MQLNTARGREWLKQFDFRILFVDGLGWDHHKQTLSVTVDSETYSLTAIAQKWGMVAFACTSATGAIPDYPTRRKIEHQVRKSAHEHIIVFVDSARTNQVWQWVKRETGKPVVCREHSFGVTQSGDALVQKLNALAVTLEEEADEPGITGITDKLGKLFADKVSKRFYEGFKDEHAKFLKFLKGIPDEAMERWYVSVMLDRLMFIYFIQKKGFLAGDPDYLRNKLAESKARGKDQYYREFLCPLFFDGFARRDNDPEKRKRSSVFGRVPYLNGGIFQKHLIETAHGKTIEIPDKAFAAIFAFFDGYRWHLDERPLKDDKEINPDVLGYIFEKYINQKQMGAYYTKEDITEYIGRNAIVPRLFDKARQDPKVTAEIWQPIWRLLREHPDQYIFEPMRRGVVDDEGNIIPEARLPDFVQKGMRDPKARMFDKRYNLGDAELLGEDGKKLTLPTETWREYVARRQRCLDLREKLAGGKVTDINDFVTYNLHIRQFAQDVIERCDDPVLLRAFWHAINDISILDPTCGSGAFLFAALNILYPLYLACLTRMQAFVSDLERSGEKHSPKKYEDFRQVLDQVHKHPNERYFILKSIIVRNLFGVDIMDEAVEICKLRLFLKLVAQVDRVEDVEPLPDIDFNIRAGNTLVGYATYDQVKQAVSGKLDFEGAMERIEEKAQEVERLTGHFRLQQTDLGGEVTAEDKQALLRRLRALEGELNTHLAREYGKNPNKPAEYDKWRESHKPFHWFVEFYGIMKSGGFGVITGNPPYLDLKDMTEYEARGYSTIVTRNLYPLILERCLSLAATSGRQGFIVPVSSVATEGYHELQAMLHKRGLLFSSYDDRPAHLFNGLDKNTLSILLVNPVAGVHDTYSTRLARWNADERGTLFALLQYRKTPGTRLTGCLPKVGSATDGSIWEKLFGRDMALIASYAGKSRFVTYYSRKVNAFLQVLDFVPDVRDGRGKKRPPSEFKELHLQSAAAAQAVFCCYNSTLFRWFIDVVTDGSHVNRREVDNFPFDPAAACRSHPELVKAAARLSSDLRQHAEKRVMRYAHDTLTVECIVPKFSKAVIDEIDQVLAKHYGFTDEELDFIINYDIKYRMGRGAGESDAEE